MRIALIADSFPPLRTSAAVQLRDLSREFAKQGHELTMMVASPELNKQWDISSEAGVQVLRLKTHPIKDVNYVRRTIGEYLMPYAMYKALKKSSLCNQRWDGIVWYSPSIFFGPIIRRLKKESECKSYLIIRDIFPEWAVDMGLMSRGLPYQVFNAIAQYQYNSADVIGIQTPGNSVYFSDWCERNGEDQLEILQNWLTPSVPGFCSIDILKTPLAGKKIFVYAGNMGIAQGMGVLIDLAEQLKIRNDVGFLFVGRGSDAEKIKKDAVARGLDNVLFYSEIDPDEISGLYAQCTVGLVALDPKHKTHNIPGKFLSYMHSGLPVLASVNAGNDLVSMIKTYGVGQVTEVPNAVQLAEKAVQLLEDIQKDPGISEKCKSLAVNIFSSEAAVKQIVARLAS